MNEMKILELARNSANRAGCPKRPRFKEFRVWSDEVWWNTSITFLFQPRTSVSIRCGMMNRQKQWIMINGKPSENVVNTARAALEKSFDVKPVDYGYNSMEANFPNWANDPEKIELSPPQDNIDIDPVINAIIEELQRRKH
jgi:hypothetical protein